MYFFFGLVLYLVAIVLAVAAGSVEDDLVNGLLDIFTLIAILIGLLLQSVAEMDQFFAWLKEKFRKS